MSGGYKIKVYGMSLGKERAIVAAMTQKEAAKLMGCSLHEFRQFAGETGNIVECGVALNQPGTVFFKPHNDVLQPFKPRPSAAGRNEP
jgi:hypothetical protein